MTRLTGCVDSIPREATPKHPGAAAEGSSAPDVATPRAIVHALGSVVFVNAHAGTPAAFAAVELTEAVRAAASKVDEARQLVLGGTNAPQAPWWWAAPSAKGNSAQPYAELEPAEDELLIVVRPGSRTAARADTGGDRVVVPTLDSKALVVAADVLGQSVTLMAYERRVAGLLEQVRALNIMRARVRCC